MYTCIWSIIWSSSPSIFTYRQWQGFTGSAVCSVQYTPAFDLLSEVFPLPSSLTDNGKVSPVVLFAQYNIHYAFDCLFIWSFSPSTFTYRQWQCFHASAVCSVQYTLRIWFPTIWSSSPSIFTYRQWQGFIGSAVCSVQYTLRIWFPIIWSSSPSIFTYRQWPHPQLHSDFRGFSNRICHVLKIPKAEEILTGDLNTTGIIL